MSRLPAPEVSVVAPGTLPQGKDLDIKGNDSVEVVDGVEYKGASPPQSSRGPVFVSSISKDEPIVTRKELWSYYCALFVFSSVVHRGER